MSTSDVYDEHREQAQVCELQLRDYGGVTAFSGEISTVRCHEDNVVLKGLLSEAGNGRVLVVDGGGSFRCALLGDNIAGLARDNGWAGVVLNACVRDVDELAHVPVGIKALGSCPRPSGKNGTGEVDVAVTFGGATFTPGATLYADTTGVVAV